MKFKQNWLATVKKKNSILCVGLDPVETGQNSNSSLATSVEKLNWCLDLIEKVAPFAAAIKPNRKYIQDFSREQTQTLTKAIHDFGMLAIDDGKITDIGATLESAIYHTKTENFDAVTFCPFAGNTKEADALAQKYDLALISLVLMSNPEFQSFKNARFANDTGFEYFAKDVAHCSHIAGIVVGAPSEANHITTENLDRLHAIAKDKLILMPGLGAQNGNAKDVINRFGQNVIANVGRAIFNHANPESEALRYQRQLNEILNLS